MDESIPVFLLEQSKERKDGSSLLLLLLQSPRSFFMLYGNAILSFPFQIVKVLFLGIYNGILGIRYCVSSVCVKDLYEDIKSTSLSLFRSSSVKYF